jgi:hypothetical protein
MLVDSTLEARHRAEGELRLWAQNALLNAEAWHHFIRGENGEVRFSQTQLKVYEEEREKLARKIYKGTLSKIVLASNKQNWLTPPYFLDLVRSLGPIALDPCANPLSFVFAWWSFFGPPNHIDGMNVRWIIPEGTVCFVNPPYGRSLSLWTAKMAAEGTSVIVQANAHLIALIPARTGTGYWEQYIWPFADAVCFWHGGIQHPSRMCFYDLDGRPADAGATFDAAVIYFGKQRDKFKEVFSPYGTVQLVN